MNSNEKLDHKLDCTSPRPTAPAADPTQINPKQAEAMEVFRKFQSQRNFGIAVDIRQISNQLTTVQERPTFPESLFVDHFLPFFAGEVPPTNEINQRAWIDKIAGNESNSVDIIDDKGVVLFTVPPVFDTSVLEQVKPGGLSITVVERQYSRLKEVDVIGSQQFLARTLGGMHIKEKPTEQVYANMKIWNAIFERYGKHDKIIDILDLKNDPNKNKPVALGREDSSDVGDFELDTD